jgi:type I restriction enzyme R subunit
MLEKLEILQDMMHGFDYSHYMGKSQAGRIRAITGGINFALGKSEREQKEFKQIAVELVKAHSLCAATPEGKIKTMEKGNLVKSERFSEKLKRALNKYRNQAITNAEVVEELIKMANEMKKDVENEKDLGMNRDDAVK